MERRNDNRIDGPDRREHKGDYKDGYEDGNEDEHEEEREDVNDANKNDPLSSATEASPTIRANDSACPICRAVIIDSMRMNKDRWLRILQSDQQGPCRDKHSPQWIAEREERSIGPWWEKTDIASNLVFSLPPGETWSVGCLRAPNGSFIKESGKRGCLFCQQAWRAFLLQQTEHKAESYVWLGSTVYGSGIWTARNVLWIDGAASGNSEIDIRLNIYRQDCELWLWSLVNVSSTMLQRLIHG